MNAPKLLIALVLVTTVSVKGDKVRVSDLPPAVQQSLQTIAGRTLPTEVNRDLRNGDLTFEARWKDESGAQREALVSSVGTILRSVVDVRPPSTNGLYTLINAIGVPLTQTPPAVQKAINTQIPTAPIDSIQRGIWNGQSIYEVTYHDNGRIRTFQLTEAGDPVNEKTPTTFTPRPRYNGSANGALPLSQPAQMAFGFAPLNVQQAVIGLADGARIDDFTRGIVNGRTVYQAAFDRAGQRMQVQVFEDGSMVTFPPGGTAAQGFTSGMTPAAVDAAIAAQAPPAAAANNVPVVGSVAVPIYTAPRAVQNTIVQAANGASVTDVESGWSNGRRVYQADVMQNGAPVRLQILEDGTLLAPPIAVGSPPTADVGAGIAQP